MLGSSSHTECLETYVTRIAGLPKLVTWVRFPSDAESEGRGQAKLGHDRAEAAEARRAIRR
jgi:hypothetical protein